MGTDYLQYLGSKISNIDQRVDQLITNQLLKSLSINSLSNQNYSISFNKVFYSS